MTHPRLDEARRLVTSVLEFKNLVHDGGGIHERRRFILELDAAEKKLDAFLVRELSGPASYPDTSRVGAQNLTEGEALAPSGSPPTAAHTATPAERCPTCGAKRESDCDLCGEPWRSPSCCYWSRPPEGAQLGVTNCSSCGAATPPAEEGA